MIELANAACGSASCHSVWVHPKTRDLYVVGDRTKTGTADLAKDASLQGETVVVYVDRPIYDRASGALVRAARASGLVRPAEIMFPADLRAGMVRVEGRAVTEPPQEIRVAQHEAAIIVHRLEADVVEALGTVV
jgi:hypothetical protein